MTLGDTIHELKLSLNESGFGTVMLDGIPVKGVTAVAIVSEVGHPPKAVLEIQCRVNCDLKAETKVTE